MIYLKLVLTMVFWAGTFVAGRKLAGRVDPYSASFLRFALASICLLLLAYWHDGKFAPIHRSQWLPLILLGLTGVFGYNLLFFNGLRHIEAGRAAVIIACNPVAIALLARWWLKERLHALKILGILISISGALVVISGGDPAAALPRNLGRGELYIMGCVACWAVFSLTGKVAMNGMSPLNTVAYSASIGAALLAVPAFAGGRPNQWLSYQWIDWLCLGYFGIFGTAVGFVWYYQGIEKIGATRASQFINLIPICAVLMAMVILRETITFSLSIGAMLVLSGLYLTNGGRISFKLGLRRPAAQNK